MLAGHVDAIHFNGTRAFSVHKKLEDGISQGTNNEMNIEMLLESCCSLILN